MRDLEDASSACCLHCVWSQALFKSSHSPFFSADAGLDLENSGHVQGPFLGLLLPPLLLSGIF